MAERIYNCLRPSNVLTPTGILRFFWILCCCLNNVVCDAADAPETEFYNKPQEDLAISASTQNYFDEWIKDTSSKVFSQTSRKELYEKAVLNNVHDYFDYVRLWWIEVFKRIYSVANKGYESIILPNLANVEPYCERRELTKRTIESTPVHSENVFQYLLLYYVIIGICLIVYLINRARVKTEGKNKNLLTALHMSEIETNVINRLATILKQTKTAGEKSQQDLEINYCTINDTPKGLEKSKIKKGVHEKKQQFNNHQYTSPDAYERKKLHKESNIYQTQINTLEQQLQNVSKKHKNEIKNYFTENKRIKDELGKNQSWLDGTTKLHKENHIKKYIAHLHDHYENTEKIELYPSLHEVEDIKHNIKTTAKSSIYPESRHFCNSSQFEEDSEHINMVKKKNSSRSPGEIKKHIQTMAAKWSQLETKIEEVVNQPLPYSKSQWKNVAELQSTEKVEIPRQSNSRKLSFKHLPYTTASKYHNTNTPKINQNIRHTDNLLDISHQSRDEFVGKSLDPQPTFENSVEKDPKPTTHQDKHHRQTALHNVTAIAKSTGEENQGSSPLTKVEDRLTDTSKYPQPTAVETQTSILNKSISDDASENSIYYIAAVENSQEHNSVQSDLSIAENLNKVEKIYAEVKLLKNKVKKFIGSKLDSAYLHLNGILIEYAIQINNIECEHKSVLWKNSKKVCKLISRCRDILDSKVNK